jgi:deoxyribose-phosphate aldolase
MTSDRIPATLDDWRSVAALIDHTLLKPDATQRQIAQLCAEAAQYRFATAFVQPVWVELAVRTLAGTGVKVGTPIGFPHGATLPSVKLFEAEEALRLGASELDIVLDIGALKAGDRKFVQDEIRAVVLAAHSRGALVKVILETPLLTTDEKITACQLSLAASADFVKTATGFSGGGATVEDVALMRASVGPGVGVKASGGIRTASDLRAMILAGANRIGTSAGVSIVREFGAPEPGTAPPLESVHY